MKKILNCKTGIFIVIIFVFLSGCLSGPDSQKNTINLTSSPLGSEVYLDNQYMGTTPVTIPDVGVGSHTLEYRHSGYQSWSNAISVSPGSSNYYAALVPLSTTQISPQNSQAIAPTQTPVQTALTIQAGKKTMVIGDSNQFSGTASGTNSVLLTLYGPGKYKNGESLVQQNVNELGNWNYIWNPGSAVESGTFTIIVSDPWKTTSERTEFTVIGGGVVSIAPSTSSALAGTKVTFSGQCTTGAQSVLLALYGPGLYTNGKELGPFSVSADKTWSFTYPLDATMPTGVYTMYVYDVPKTSSGNTQFTIGYS